MYIKTFKDDILGKHCSFKDDMIVLFINEGQCFSCIIEILAYLEQTGKKIGKEKLLVLANYKNHEEFNIFKDIASAYIQNVVQCNNLKLPEDILVHPTVFIANSKSELSYLFIPDFYPEFKEVYFSKLLPQYFEVN